MKEWNHILGIFNLGKYSGKAHFMFFCNGNVDACFK